MTNQEQFEAWHRSVVAGDPPHEKYNSGDYRNQHVQRYWFGWRASREALRVELPAFAGYQDHIVRELQAAFTASVEAAGLKVVGHD